MIEVCDVTKCFGEFKALDELNMTVPTGTVYGLVGPSGAGKSTIIRHITGIYRQDSGTITVDGAPVYENPAVKGRIEGLSARGQTVCLGITRVLSLGLLVLAILNLARGGFNPFIYFQF